jgi:hypothetical protein
MYRVRKALGWGNAGAGFAPARLFGEVPWKQRKRAALSRLGSPS